MSNKTFENMNNLIKYVCIAFTIVFYACDGGKTTKVSSDKFNTIVFQECEYIYHPYDGLKSVTHKGNCKNPIHKCK